MEAFNLIPPVGFMFDTTLAFAHMIFSGYDTVVYERSALDLCIKVAGSPENGLYGSDYPHNIGDMIGCLARVNALPSDQSKRIAGKSAERIFKL